ncbi:hypothetical protein HY522_07385 [bacterium]|nr:hypothetical protein [bacterium]
MPLKTRLAVVPVQGGGPLQSGLTELLTAELIQTGRFIVVERSSLAEVQAEQARGSEPGFWAEGKVTPRMIPAHLLLMVKALSSGLEQDALVGTITEGKGGGFRLKRAKSVLEVRLLDVGTGQILESRVVEASATGGDLAAGVGAEGVMVGTAVFNSSAAGRAAKDAIKKAARALMEKFPNERWETRVADVGEDGKVYIAAGLDDGLQAGRLLNLHRPGRAVVDPTTGVQLAVTDVQIGQVRVDQAWPAYSTGTAISDTAPRRGDILRPRF